MLADFLSVMRSHFRCRLLHLLTLCSPPLASDVFECCLLVRRVTIDVQVAESMDQDFPSMFLRRHRRKKKLAEIIPPGANVLLTARHHPAVSRNSQNSVSVSLWLLESR